MKHTLFISSLVAFFFLAACEDLEDTYEQYAGNGPIRYLASCSEVKVESGFERLNVLWKNALDPKRAGVWVRCQSDTYLLDTLVPGDSISCNIRGLADATYNVTVGAVSSTGDTSLLEQKVGRPYTATHEAVMGFTRGIRNYIFMKDKLFLFLAEKSQGMLDFVLHYTKTDGSPGKETLALRPWSENQQVIENVDASKPVVLSRKGMLEECPDTIDFPAYLLKSGLVNMASDFSGRLMERYGEIDLEQTELELDYDLTSMKDLLYFKNLKKLTLGGNRYYGTKYGNPRSRLTEDEYGSIASFVLEQLHETNPDFQVVNYGNQYNIGSDYDFITNGGYTAPMPELDYLDATDFAVSVNEDKLEKDICNALFDDTPDTYWESTIGQEQRTYQLVIDMQEAKEVKGVKIAQLNTYAQASKHMPDNLRLTVSVDGQNWTNPCHTESHTIGKGKGEAVLLRFNNPQSIRYIRVQLQDVYNGMNTGCVIGDIMSW